MSAGTAHSRSTGYDVEAVRGRFSALSRQVDGKPLAYLDCAATSLRPDSVIDEGCHFCRLHDGNPHRGMHTLSMEATQVYESSRRRVARWLEADSDKSVVITRNATAAINTVARGLRADINESHNVVVSRMEHHANLIPWQQLCQETGAELRFIDLTDDGLLDVDRLLQVVDEQTAMVAVTMVSNVLGTINPVRLVVDAARRVGAMTLLDGAQAVGHMPVSFASLGADFLVFSAHKCYGPGGLGFLLGREDALYQLAPSEFGGDMIEYVGFEEATWADIPERFEAGTANSQAVAAFPKSIEFIEELGVDNIRRHEEALVAYTMQKLSQFPDIRILGPSDPAQRGGLVSFVDPLVPPHDMSTILDQQGVAVRAGHHCAQPLHRLLKIPASTRVSFGVYTTFEDIDQFIDGVTSARALFTR